MHRMAPIYLFYFCYCLYLSMVFSSMRSLRWLQNHFWLHLTVRQAVHDLHFLVSHPHPPVDRWAVLRLIREIAPECPWSTQTFLTYFPPVVCNFIFSSSLLCLLSLFVGPTSCLLSHATSRLLRVNHQFVSTRTKGFSLRCGKDRTVTIKQIRSNRVETSRHGLS